jgi:hypothetical protein
VTVIQATLEVEIGRIKVQGQSREKELARPHLHKLARSGGAYLYSQLCRRHRKKDCGSDQPEHKCKILCEK